MKLYEELAVDALECFAGFDKKAMCILAEKYEYGDNVEKNLNKAIELYQRAADNNYAKGMYKLGNIYFDGKGVEQNYETALKLYKRAGARNHVLAMAQVGKCYHNGYGTEKDDRKAALQGNEDAKVAWALIEIEKEMDNFIDWEL